MEILSRGELPQEKSYVLTCHRCKTTFKFMESEARRFGDQREGDYLQIQCPVCKEFCYQTTL